MKCRRHSTVVWIPLYVRRPLKFNICPLYANFKKLKFNVYNVDYLKVYCGPFKSIF